MIPRLIPQDDYAKNGYMNLLKITFLYLGLALVALIQPSCQSTKSSAGTGFLSSYSGLQRHSKLSKKRSYVGDINKIRNYNAIYLEEVAVFQPKDMAKKKIKPEDLIQLQQNLRSSLYKELVDSRFHPASSAGPQTLSVRIAIVDITPGDPLMFAASSAPYAGTATAVAGAVTGAKFGRGSAKIEVELLDSFTRERIYSAIDENVGTKLEFIQGMTRWGHIELAVKQWAKRFRKYMDDPSSLSN